MQCFSIGATNAVLSSCWRVCGCRQAGVIPVTTKAFWPQQSTWNSKYREFGSCYSLLHCLPPWTPTSDVCRQYDVIPVTTKPFLPKKTFVLCLLYSKASTTRLCNTSDNQGILAWTRKDPLKLIYQVTFPMKWKSHLKMSMFDLSARWFQIAGVGADLFSSMLTQPILTREPQQEKIQWPWFAFLEILSITNDDALHLLVSSITYTHIVVI